MPEPVQTLSAGLSIAQQYGSWGVSGGGGSPDFDRLFMLVMGRKQTGKTTIWLDDPAALVINFDGSSTPIMSAEASQPVCQFWPARNQAGEFVNAQGKPMVLSWGEVEQMKLRLLEAARLNQPRPKTIVFDSITAALRLAKDYIVEQSVKLGLTSKNADTKEYWRQLDGRSSYDVLYDMLVDISIELWQAGYGVVWNVHVVDTRIKQEGKAGEEPIFRDRSELSITDNFLNKRVLAYFELIMYVSRSREEKTIPVPTPTVIDGKTVNIMRDKTVVRDVMTISFRGDPVANEPQDRLPCSRIPMPETLRIFPKESSPFNSIVSAYNAARSSVKWQK